MSVGCGKIHEEYLKNQDLQKKLFGSNIWPIDDLLYFSFIFLSLLRKRVVNTKKFLLSHFVASLLNFFIFIYCKRQIISLIIRMTYVSVELLKKLNGNFIPYLKSNFWEQRKLKNVLPCNLEVIFIIGYLCRYELIFAIWNRKIVTTKLYYNFSTIQCQN